MAKWKEQIDCGDGNTMSFPDGSAQSYAQSVAFNHEYMKALENAAALQTANPYPFGNVPAYQMGVAEPDPNTSGIRPVQYCVLVKPDDVEKTTKGGIILPDTKVEKDEFQRMEGVLVAASPMAFTFKDWPEDAKGLRPRVGDRVIFARYNATELTGRDGAKYWLMKDEAIVGVME